MIVFLPTVIQNGHRFGQSVTNIVVDDFAIFLDILPTIVYFGMTILSLMRHLAISGDIFVVTTGKEVLLAS